MKIFTAIIFFLFCSRFAATAQLIDSTIARYARDFAQEKAYVQYDKSAYAPGDTIWFKSYLMKGIVPADDSRTFYIDWTDDNGKLLEHTVTPVVDATGSGQYAIPAGYKGKFIHVRAYTKWMLNFDSSFLYEKDLRIIPKDIPQAASNKAPISYLEFFPEGGDLVAGVANKIAFKANDQWGRPLKVKGNIENDKGENVASLNVFHDGMGYFFITPSAGESFRVKWTDERNKEYISPLPTTKATGVAMQLTVAGTKRHFVISAEQATAKEIGVLNIIGTMNQFQVFKIAQDLSSGTVKGVIPTQGLPSGILTITVFDKQWKPLAERITFINNDEFRFNAGLVVEHWGLNKRARNEIVLTVPDSLAANFAVSVTDAGIETDSSDNIISRLLLTSELKGQVHHAAQYFSNNSDSIAQRLDLVMLTHGWRRFNWESVVKNKFPAIRFPKDTSYLSLSGRIYGALPAQLTGATIILVVNQKSSTDGNKMVFLEVAPNGTFNDPEYFLFDTAHIFYQLPKGIGNGGVRFMEDRLPALGNRLPAAGYFQNQFGDTTGYARHFQLSDETLRILNQLEGKLMENVIVKTRVKTPIEILDEKYASALFSGGDNYKFDLVNDKTIFPSNNIFQFLQARVAGLQISTPPPTMRWRGGEPQVFLDEVPVDLQFVSSLTVSQIAYVKAFRPGSFVGTGHSSNGAIAIYTRKGGDVTNGPVGLSSSTVSGYTPVREFYSPKYVSKDIKNEERDIRTTLYWNPQVVTTPGKNKVKLTFYNNDISQSFRVVVEGMTSDGQLVRLEQVME